MLDLVSALNANGIPSSQIPAKIEGIAFGQDVLVGGQLEHTLWIANDNDFLATAIPNGSSTPITNPNRFYVFAFTDADLGGNTVFQNQQLVPAPATVSLLAAGLLGWMGAARKASKKS